MLRGVCRLHHDHVDTSVYTARNVVVERPVKSCVYKYLTDVSSSLAVLVYTGTLRMCLHPTEKTSGVSNRHDDRPIDGYPYRHSRYKNERPVGGLG